MSQNRMLILVLTLLAAALVAAWRGGLFTQRPAEAAPAAGDAHPHEEPDGDEPHGTIHLTDAQARQAGIVVETASPRRLDLQLSLPGEVTVNSDRTAHIVPRVPGVVVEVRKNLGDTVQPGEVMAVLDSRDLADAKTAYLAARERVALARATHQREEQLWQKRISAEQEYLAARNALAEAVIEMDSAEQKLHSIGFSDTDLEAMATGPEKDLTRYAIVAPFAATIIDKHITLGEVIRDDTSVFLIADLRTVWIELSVHQHDLPLIRRGQRVAVSGGPGQQADGEVSFIGTQLADQTRTLPLRVVLPNPDGRWRPGLFVTGAVTVNDIEVPVAAPAEAVVLVEGRPTVFVRTAAGFEARTVTTGRGDGRRVEITGGVRPGEVMVIQGAFTLKSELDKPEAHEH